MSSLSEWPKAVASIAMMVSFLFVITIFFPLPWVLLGRWLEERMKIKRILAEARLLEAQNASKAAPLPETGSDTGGDGA